MVFPLDGIRVIDLTQYQQGPVATQMLADMGAEVIKIEPRGTGDPGRGLGFSYFQANNRNKKSITVNTRTEKGKEIVYRLVEKSDVFAQNFRSGVAERLGFGYEALARINPKIIYLTGSAFGLKGPMGKKPGYDGVGQAMSGILSTIWSPEGIPPTSMGCSVSDQTGAFMLAFGAMVALFYRERTGVGQEVDVSLLGSTMTLVGWTFEKHLRDEPGMSVMNVQGARLAPFKSGFGVISSHLAKDGKPLILLLQRRPLLEKCLEVLGLEKFLADPRYESGEKIKEYAEDVLKALSEKIRSKDRDEWLKLFDEAEVIAAPIHTLDETAAHPQVLANEYIAEVDHPKGGHIKILGLPVKLHKTPGRVGLAPELGQHTDVVLTGMAGYSPEEIAQMRKEEVI